MTPTLPACPARFAARKAALLAQLAQPDADYTDASPKGAVDEGVRPLLAAINALDGFVTTSSCAGRVAVFLEGRRGPGVAEETTAAETRPASATTASSGGKGGGGRWLFVSHDPLVAGPGAPYGSYGETDWAAVFGLDAAAEDGGAEAADTRLVHFKFEPMILHVLTASPAHAQLLLRCALAAGFRESGAVGIVPGEGGSNSGNSADPAMPMVAVRSMGLGLASVVGVGRDGDGNGGGGGGGSDGATCIVSRAYLARLVRVGDERFAVNRARTARFQAALLAATAPSPLGEGAAAAGRGRGWEDAAARRARKRAEGLQRQAAQRREEQEGEKGREGDGGEADTYETNA